MLAEEPLWIVWKLKSGSILALVDTGAQFSCIRIEVAEYLRRVGESCVFEPFLVGCILADGTRCAVTNSVRLQVKVFYFTWKYGFKLLKVGTFPIILVLDFLQRTSIVVDMASTIISFRFSPQCSGRFGNSGEGIEREPFFQNLLAQVCGSAEGKGGGPKNFDVEVLSSEFPMLFSPVLRKANFEPYEIELSDATPVRSEPYRCAPPKAAVFKEMVNGLLEQGVMRPNKSPYANAGFLVPKHDGVF